MTTDFPMPQFDAQQMHAALAAAARLVDTNQLPENGLAQLTERPSTQPLTYTDELGNVWPHVVDAPIYAHLKYQYTQAEVQEALRASRGVIVVQTVPSTVVPQVTGQAPAPVDTRPLSVQASELRSTRAAMLGAFTNPMSSK